MNIKQILSISRPHFWLYEFGTYGIGLLIAYVAVGFSLSVEILLFGLYFLIPANILIYGINDIFDYETDMLNPKKDSYEDVLQPQDHKKVFLWIGATTVPFIIYGIFFISSTALLAFLVFVFFATFYSTPPIRAKARPVFDSIFSGSHYVGTAVFAYLLVYPEFSSINWWYVCAGLLWTVAMHAYSAVPDIDADRQAGVPTIATKLEKKHTLVLCLVLYVASFVILGYFTSWLFLLLAAPYIYLVAKSFKVFDQELFGLYTYFPYLNALCGAVVTIYIIALL